ncbi:MAG: hypothetical protein ACJ75B_22455 [Flavisolibacter sp.]
MEGQAQTMKANKQRENLKAGAKVALIVLLLNIVGQLAAVYQTRYQLVSPLIPETTIWEISKQFIFHAIASACASVFGLLLYFFDRYLLVIILVGLILITDIFIYV